MENSQENNNKKEVMKYKEQIIDLLKDYMGYILSNQNIVDKGIFKHYFGNVDFRLRLNGILIFISARRRRNRMGIILITE